MYSHVYTVKRPLPHFYQTSWLYSIVLINIFGALFGVMTSCLLFRSNMQLKHEKEKIDRRSGLFAMFGK